MALGAGYATVIIPPFWCAQWIVPKTPHTQGAKRAAPLLAFRTDKPSRVLPQGPPQSHLFPFRGLPTEPASARHLRETMEGTSSEMNSPKMVILVCLDPYYLLN